MVGVAGKSKGCNTCRARKIACDQQRPDCGQCTRSNRVCGGYRRERVFVLVQPSAAAKKKHTFLRSSPSSESESNAELSDHVVETSKSSSTGQLVTRDWSNGADYSFAERGTAYAMMQTQNERHNLVLAFLSNCLPTQWTSSPRSWISLLAELPTGVKALEIAGAAVAASAIGNRFQDAALKRHSLNLYTQGLQQLQSALWNRNLARDDGTLAACMALSLYEAMECPDAGSEGYFSHCRGLLALVEARGIQAHSSGAGHQLFLGVRIPGILYALERQVPSFMFESSWMEQPWEVIPKTFFSQVVDCLAKAPRILQRVYLLQHLSPEDQIQLCHELIRECWQIDEKIDTIWNGMHNATPDPLYWLVPSRVSSASFDSESSDNLFPIVFCFANPECATTLILLWAVRVMLWSGLCNLYNGIVAFESLVLQVIESPFDSTSTAGAVKPPLPALGHRRDYISMAHNVCQSVEYLLQDELLLAGPLSVCPALGIVIDTLRDQPPYANEVIWLQKALGVVRQRGIGLLKYSR
ncbi:C6 zinc finger domain protein [Aspergillus ellipticus CBS 707.79]|uniref:C6 zinc finger domain protein n=1 Tax=Aspergillus ellipticus CBS 707.79 TaxID=1448320 RepID=A0A319CZV2_9EURO|nr:C6 zinc finger domain protein [Aspergillus ellipticus CBS 707.79]